MATLVMPMLTCMIACSDVYIAYLAWLLVTAALAYMVYRYGTRKLR